MKENLHDIDKIFLDGLEQHQASPSDRVWNTVENDLDKKNVIHITKKYDSLKKIAAILIILLAGVTGYLLFIPENKKSVVNNNTGNEHISIKPTILNNNHNPSITKFENHKNSDDSEILLKNIAKGNDEIDNNLTGTKIVGNEYLNKNYSKAFIVSSNKKSLYADKVNLPLFVRSDAEKRDEILSENSKLKSQNVGKYYFDPDYEKFIIVNRTLRNTEPPFLGNVSSLKIIPSVNAIALQSKNLLKSNHKSLKGKAGTLISLGAYYSPDLSFNTLRNDHPHGRENDREHLKNNERHAYSFSSGLSVAYKLNKHISIQSGIGISQTEINNKPKDIMAERDNGGDIKYRFDASCGYGFILPKSGPQPNLGDTLKGVSSVNKLSYVQVPISVQYNMMKHKLGVNAQLGVSLNTLTSGSILTSVNNGNVKESQVINSVQGLKKHSVTGLLGIGVEYKINKLISMTFMPTAKIALSSINKGSAVKSYPNSLSLAAGLKISL